ncbi:MAG TPA: CHASE2 domain-containing protein [Bryobacteraceae bacterium]|jgi:hypothetical protein|nr:CHASE2 domain-containing protein [Bryobacteraceae bacterium]
MKFVRRKRTDLLWALFLAFFLQWLDYHGWFGSLNGRIFNWILINSSPKSDSAASRAIFTVEINDQAYEECFHSTSPMNPTRVVNLVREIAKAKPGVIGIDILTEDHRYLSQSLDVQDSAAVWASGYTGDPIASTSFLGWLFGYEGEGSLTPTKVLGEEPEKLPDVPQKKWGPTIFPRDEDLVIRRFPRSIKLNVSKPPKTVDSWASKVAESFCTDRPCTNEKAEEIYISYAGIMPRSFEMMDLFSCPSSSDEVIGNRHSWDTFQYLAKGKIVLVGGTFHSSRDFYQTPAGELPGLMINAYAVKAELEGNGLKTVPQPWTLLLDLGLGVFIIWICELHPFKNLFNSQVQLPRISDQQQEFITGILVVLSVCILSRYVAGGRYLLGFAGEGTGVLLDKAWRLWRNNGESKGKRPRTSRGSAVIRSGVRVWLYERIITRRPK